MWYPRAGPDTGACSGACGERQDGGGGVRRRRHADDARLRSAVPRAGRPAGAGWSPRCCAVRSHDRCGSCVATVTGSRRSSSAGALRGKLVTDVETVGEQFAQYVLVELAAARHLAPAALASAVRPPHGARVGVAGRVPAPARAATRRRRRAVHRLDAIGRSIRRPAQRAELPRRREAAAARPWLEERRWVHAEVWAYGDSAGDRELLARADHPVWVNGATISEIPEVVAG